LRQVLASHERSSIKVAVQKKMDHRRLSEDLAEPDSESSSQQDELQLARLAGTRTVDFKLAASLRHSFQPSRAGLLSSLSEVEA
jgi:hypothetical protein